MKNNGFLLVAESIEAVVSFSISAEKCCQVQVLAEMAAKGREFGPPHPIGDVEAADTYKSVGTEIAGAFRFISLFISLLNQLILTVIIVRGLSIKP